MASLKEQLQARPTYGQMTFKPQCAPDLEITIRRITVAERDEVFARFPNDTGAAPTQGRGSQIAVAILSKSLVPSVPESDLLEMDSALVDEITREVNAFHGWTAQARAQLTDQFRSPA